MTRNYAKTYASAFISRLYDFHYVLIASFGLLAAFICYKLSFNYPLDDRKSSLLINLSASFITVAFTVILVDFLRAQREKDAVKYSSWSASLECRSRLSHCDIYILEHHLPGFKEKLEKLSGHHDDYYAFIEDGIKTINMRHKAGMSYFDKAKYSDAFVYNEVIKHLTTGIETSIKDYGFALDSKSINTLRAFSYSINLITDASITKGILMIKKRKTHLDSQESGLLNGAVHMYFHLRPDFYRFLKKRVKY